MLKNSGGLLNNKITNDLALVVNSEGRRYEGSGSVYRPETLRVVEKTMRSDVISGVHTDDLSKITTHIHGRSHKKYSRRNVHSFVVGGELH